MQDVHKSVILLDHNEAPQAVEGIERADILEIIDQWYSPGSQYFKVKAEDLYIYLLKHDIGQDTWTLEYLEKSASDS
jgi:hypothetical protein